MVKRRLRLVAVIIGGVGAILLGLGVHLSVYTGHLQTPLLFGAAVCIAVLVLLYAFFQVEPE
jgi:hypothetical protein